MSMVRIWDGERGAYTMIVIPAPYSKVYVQWKARAAETGVGGNASTSLTAVVARGGR